MFSITGGGGSLQTSAHSKQDLDRRLVVESLAIGGSGGTGGSGSSGKLRLIGDGSRVWIATTIPDAVFAYPPGTKWAETTPSSLQSQDLRISLATPLLYIVRGATRVRDEGADTVNGMPVRRYSFPIDLHQAYCRTPSRYRLAVQRAVNLQSSQGSVALKLNGTEWVDRSGRAVKVNLAADVGDGSGDTLKLVSEVQVAELLTPIKVVPPPAAKVTQLSAHPDLESALPIHPQMLPAVACP